MGAAVGLSMPTMSSRARCSRGKRCHAVTRRSYGWAALLGALGALVVLMVCLSGVSSPDRAVRDMRESPIHKILKTQEPLFEPTSDLSTRSTMVPRPPPPTPHWIRGVGGGVWLPGGYAVHKGVLTTFPDGTYCELVVVGPDWVHERPWAQVARELPIPAGAGAFGFQEWRDGLWPSSGADDGGTWVWSQSGPYDHVESITVMDDRGRPVWVSQLCHQP